MQCLKGQDELGDVLPGLLLADQPLPADEFAEVAPRVVIHDQEQLGGGLEGEVEFDHEGVVDDAHHVPLGEGIPLEVRGHHFVLAEDLHCKQFLVGVSFLVAQEHLAEGPLAQLPMKHEVLSGDACGVDHGALDAVGRKLVGDFGLCVLLVLPVLFEAVLVEEFLEGGVTAVVDGGESVLVLGDAALGLQQEEDDVLVAVLSCEVEGGVAVVVAGVCVDFVVE